MSSFVARYYYCLTDDAGPNQSLASILNQNEFTEVAAKTAVDFTSPAGFYWHLTDNSGKMAILAVKTPAVEGDWTAALKSLQDWEIQSGLCNEDLVGKLTVLVSSDHSPGEYLTSAVPFLPIRAASYPSGEAPLVKLPIDRRDSQAVYILRSPSGDTAADGLLGRRLPNLHAQMIYLSELNAVLRDRDNTICIEREDLSQQLIRILHTKLVMNQPAMDANKELENEIEGLATAYAKLVSDKKLVSDGIRRMEVMLKGAQRKFLNEAALRLDKEAVDAILAAYHNRVRDLYDLHEDLVVAEENYQAAINVVQSKIQVMNSRTNLETQEQIRELLHINLEMQKQSLVYQFAAGLIEFIILAYYSLSIWTNVAPVAAAVIPGWLKFIFVFLFSGTTVAATHYLSEFLQGDPHVRRRLILIGIVLAIILLAIILGTWSANLTPGIQPPAPAH